MVIFMNILKIIGKIMNLWANCPLERIDVWLVKKLSYTKIDNYREWVTLNYLCAMYRQFYSLSMEVEDEVEKTKAVMENFNRIRLLVENLVFVEENGIVKEWFVESMWLKDEITKNLDCFLQQERMEFYAEASSKAIDYCKIHEKDYEEWQIETEKYYRWSTKIDFFLAFICLIIILALSNSMHSIKYEFYSSEILEENGDAFDELEIEQILKRKL